MAYAPHLLLAPPEVDWLKLNGEPVRLNCRDNSVSKCESQGTQFVCVLRCKNMPSWIFNYNGNSHFGLECIQFLS
jgi:hypothetical protein